MCNVWVFFSRKSRQCQDKSNIVCTSLLLVIACSVAVVEQFNPHSIAGTPAKNGVHALEKATLIQFKLTDLRTNKGGKHI